MSLVKMIFFFIFIKKVFVVVVGVSNHSVDVFEQLRKGKYISSFYISPVAIEGAVSEKVLNYF
jgi:hypothetical protein